MIAYLTLHRRLRWLGSSVLRMLEFFPRDRQPEVEGEDITVVVATVRNKQTMRWRMRRCASRLCHNLAHHKGRGT